VHAGDLDKVTALLAEVGTRAPEHPAIGLVSVPVSGDDAMTRTVAALAERSIPVVELALRLPSLDEVFYSLTGHTADPSGASGTDASGASATDDKDRRAA
jgi:oleandomycin transport system ATP-binding protein